jgi:hypothetical protein
VKKVTDHQSERRKELTVRNKNGGRYVKDMQIIKTRVLLITKYF